MVFTTDELRAMSKFDNLLSDVKSNIYFYIQEKEREIRDLNIKNDMLKDMSHTTIIATCKNCGIGIDFGSPTTNIYCEYCFENSDILEEDFYKRFKAMANRDLIGKFLIRYEKEKSETSTS